jgi:hypothetical protein
MMSMPTTTSTGMIVKTIREYEKDIAASKDDAGFYDDIDVEGIN